jgi:hypothetical protein
MGKLKGGMQDEKITQLGSSVDNDGGTSADCGSPRNSNKH